MASESEEKFMALVKMLEQEFPKDKLVRLGEMTESISKVSNVRVRDRKVEEYYELGIDDINDEGVLTVPQNPKKFAPANESAIKSQRLHRGDLIFGYRGKMGRVGLINDEFEVPVVTNNGMIRIRFPEERRDETPRYVQTYLESPLIQSFLNNMLEDRGKVKVLSVGMIEALPIPNFQEMGGVAQFTTLIDRRRQATLSVSKIIDEAKILLKKRKELESEAISLQFLPMNDLRKINDSDHGQIDILEQISLRFEMLKKEESSNSVLLKEFQG